MIRTTLSLFLILSFFGCGGGKQELVATDSVVVRTVVESISASGKIQPEVEVKISSDVSGEIVTLYVAEGDSVKVGQLLLEINPDIYRSQSEQSEAVMRQSEANLASSKSRQAQSQAQFVQAELTYKRNQQLFEKKALSMAEFEQGEAQFLVAKNELEAAKEAVRAAEFTVQSNRAALRAANENLARTRILSPMQGVVSKLNIEQGERVVGTAQMTGTEMLRVANLANMEVRVEVNENDIVKVKLGDTASVEVDAYPNRKFTGLVTAIANSPKTTQQQLTSDEITNFEVRVRILPESYADIMESGDVRYSPFRPGMTASVDIRTRKAENVLSVPVASVTTRSDTTATAQEEEALKEYVFVVNENKVQLREVSTGIQDSRFIEIQTGLNAGEKVVEAPYSAIARTLNDGDAVKVVPRELLYRRGQ
jgi:HlyD family secretion protein